MAPFALTIFQLPRVDVKLDAVYDFLRLYLFLFLFLFLFYRTEFLFMYTGLGDRNLKKITNNKIT